MSNKNTNKIFCSTCGKRALAQLNSTPFCTNCLLNELDSLGSHKKKRYVCSLFDPDNPDIWQDYWPDTSDNEDMNHMQSN